MDGIAVSVVFIVLPGVVVEPAVVEAPVELPRTSPANAGADIACT